MTEMIYGALIALAFILTVSSVIYLRRRALRRALTGARPPAVTAAGSTPAAVPPVTAKVTIASLAIGNPLITLDVIALLALIVIFWWDRTVLPEVALKEYGGVPLVFWTLAVITIIALVLSRSKSSGSLKIGLPRQKSFMAKIIISFAVLTAFWIMLYQINPDAPLFNTPEGYGHIAWYYILSALLALVAANLEGKPWFVNFALVVIMFSLLGPRTGMLLEWDMSKPKRYLASWFSGSGNNQVVRAVPVPAVNYYVPKTEVQFGTQPLRVNPSGRYVLQLWHTQCIKVQRAASANDRRIYTHCNGKLPDDTEYVWSADGPFVGAYALLQAR